MDGAIVPQPSGQAGPSHLESSTRIILAKAGIQGRIPRVPANNRGPNLLWIPAFAGMTGVSTKPKECGCTKEEEGEGAKEEEGQGGGGEGEERRREMEEWVEDEREWKNKYKFGKRSPPPLIKRPVSPISRYIYHEHLQLDTCSQLSYS